MHDVRPDATLVLGRSLAVMAILLPAQEIIMTTLGMLTMQATLSTRSNFAVHHMRVAVWHAESARAVEQANDVGKFGPWFDDMMMHVPVSVVMAGAALEASSNEIIQDILDNSTGMQLSNGGKALLKDLKDEQSGNAMERYRKLALLLDKTPPTSGAAWQDAQLLVRFRNSFMHFKPAWDSETGVHDSSLVKGLKTRISVMAAYQPKFLFPYGFLHYECAKWAVESARKMSAEFCLLIGVQDRFNGGNILP